MAGLLYARNWRSRQWHRPRLAPRLATQGFRVHLADVARTADLAAELGAAPHTIDVSRPHDSAVDRRSALAPDPRPTSRAQEHLRPR
jgi:hypothetical protein